MPRYPGIPGDLVPVVAVPEVYTQPSQFQVAVGTANVIQGPNKPSRVVWLKAGYDNAGRVTVGFTASLVIAASQGNGSINLNMGYELAAGDATPALLLDNSNRLYVVADSSAQRVTGIVLA